MKTVTVREARAKFSHWLRAAQEERVVITSHGAPVAVLTGVEGRDMTEVVMEYDERLVAALKRAERGPFTPIEEVRAELGLPRRGHAARSPRKTRRAK
jgi:prevent-host-death family protein